MTPEPSTPTPGAEATARARALDEFRRRTAESRGGVWGHPGITLGPIPAFGNPFGPGGEPPHFPKPPSAPAEAVAAGGSLFQSLGTMLRLSVDVVNCGLQGFLAAAGSQKGGCSCGCNSGGWEESCCGEYAAPSRGCGCGCGCNPSVNNCP